LGPQYVDIVNLSQTVTDRHKAYNGKIDRLMDRQLVYVFV